MSWGRLPTEPKVEGEVAVERRAVKPGRRFEGLNCLVTGSGRGFGRLIALALAREGGNVVVHYNTSSDSALKTAKEIEAMGVKAFTVKADVTKWDEVKQAVDKVWREFGPVDVLVNNVGDTAPGQMSWREITEERIDRVLAVDIKGTLFMTHEVGSRMLERKKGVIVNICSNVISTGSPRAPQYAASKYGVLGLTKSYAQAFAPWVRVNAAAPGYMETESLLSRPDWTPERRKWVVEHTPLRRIGRPEDVVPVVLFLASDDSVHMTGNVVVCDGGFSMPGA
ncbi:MAG: SDR family oxidoreductase [Candidatus Caldarchaeum sp.]|uniref:SDR family oxidoreductase n=1 Tax=Caldiarchaeum subterraneum TaxID=311458 RepID=A0A7J3VTX5_CALS0